MGEQNNLPAAETAPPVVITTLVTPQQLADQFVTVIESGFSDWLVGVKLESAGDVAWDNPADRGPWYSNPRRYEDPDLRLRITVEDDDAGSATTDHFITQKEIADGLQKLAADKGYCHHFADIVAETGDAITADVMLQFIVFGEEVFA
jgi:hypothetical protein